MRGLKVAVVSMGVLIVAGVVVLAVALAQRVGGLSGAAGPVASATLDEPAGTHITGISLAPDRMALQLGGGGADRVVIVDTKTGRVLGRVGLGQ